MKSSSPSCENVVVLAINGPVVYSLAELRKIYFGQNMSPLGAKQEIHRPGFKGTLTIAVIKFFGLLPLGVARSLGAFLGWWFWLVNDRSVKITRKNISMCFPNISDKEKNTLTRHSVLETGKLAAEICVIRQRGIEWLRSKIFKVHGEGLIKQEIAKGRGLILLAPHLGNWEVLSLTLPSYGELTALYQPPKQRYLDVLIKNAREKTGAVLVPADRRGIVKLLASLKNGGITAVLPDQNPARGFGEFSPFYGHPAYTMTTVHGFLKRTQCSAVLGFVKRVPGGFETYFLKAPEEIYSTNQRDSLAALNCAIEKCIAYCPEQYQWEYKRFKKIPPGGERPY